MSGGADVLELRAGSASLVVSAADGGRLTSVVVGGRELLWANRNDGLYGWGSYPMVPWAGRIRHGRFAFLGREYQLPINMPPHALHGVVLDRPWTMTGPDSMTIDLDERWPFRGRVRQDFALSEDGLAVTLTVEADEPMPAMVGWHPWFRRVLSDGEAPVTFEFSADEMLVRDAEGMPTGERVAPSAGPWDDAFTGVTAGPTLTWPGLRLELGATSEWWVVYSEPGHAICVEPQSGPPNAANSGPDVAAPGAPLAHTMTWRWSRT